MIEKVFQMVADGQIPGALERMNALGVGICPKCKSHTIYLDLDKVCFYCEKALNDLIYLSVEIEDSFNDFLDDWDMLDF